MRTVIVLPLLLLLPACWADFPDNLLEPDMSPGPDIGQADHRVSDGPASDGSGADAIPGDAGSSPKALGKSCKKAVECYSGRCVDGVCCNSDCTGKCMACDIAAKMGQCSPVTEGEDPDKECAPSAQNTCGLDGMCDGRGGCGNWAPGTLCASQACSGSGSDKVILARVCDGNGACVSFGELDCSPYKCDPGSKRCYDACTSTGASECVAGKQCVSGKCDGASKPDGADCTLGLECASGHCTDGVCCDEACSGSCRTCSLSPVGATSVPPIVGRCIDAPAGLDPDNECSASAKHSCQEDGGCDGSGGCRMHRLGTVCQVRLCNIQTTPHQLEPFHVCDGAGQCLESGSATSCGDYVCISGLSCYGQCTSDTHCAPGKTCNTLTFTCQ